jgi:capsule polysaccharide modification protein KpsS
LLKYFINRDKFKDYDYESENISRHNIRAPFRTIRRNFRILLQKNIFEKSNPKDKYFFFPLQYEPEASTLVLATYYSNQLATIKNIAFTLPFPYKLYLKEHPGSIGTRLDSFYQELKNIPNVVLLSSEESTPEIVAGARGVITVTSTVGMEAALSGKPVYVLGNVFYSYHPLCKKVMNFRDLKERIREDLKRKPDISSLKEINLRFIASYLRNTICANIFLAQEKKDTNDYELICREIRDFFKKKK